MKQLELFLKKYSSQILTGLGCLGVIVTPILAVKQDRKADEDRLKQENKRFMDTYEYENRNMKWTLSKKERFLLYAKYQIPTILMGTGTILCIIGAQGINRQAQTSLISAYGLINESYADYRRKNIELYGSENHKNILNELAIEKSKPVDICTQGVFTSPDLNGNKLSESYPRELFYDEFSKRYFESTLPAVIEAEYHTNRNLMLGAPVILNDYYAFLGLEQTIEGNELGWFECDDYIWIDFTNEEKHLKDGTRYISIQMEYEPTMDWQDEW